MPYLYTTITRPVPDDDPQWFDVRCDFYTRVTSTGYAGTYWELKYGPEFELIDPEFQIEDDGCRIDLTPHEIAMLREWWNKSETQALAHEAALDQHYDDDFGAHADYEYERRRDERMV